MQKHYKNVKLLKSIDNPNFFFGEVRIANGKVAKIGKSLPDVDGEEIVDLQGKIMLPAFQNLSCDLRNLSSAQLEQVILDNVATGVTSLIIISNDLILCKYLLNKMSLNWKIACSYESDIDSIDRENLLLFVEPAKQEENVLDDISNIAAQKECGVFVDLFGNLQETGELNSVTGQLPINYIENFGLLDRGGYLSGAICSDKEDYRLLSQYDFQVVTRPVSDLRKGNGFANSIQIENAGLKLAYGSGEEEKIDMFQIGRAVLLGTRGLLADESVIREDEVLKNLMVADGIAEGQDANFVVLDGEFENITDIVNYATQKDVLMTISNGKTIYIREDKNEN